MRATYQIYVVFLYKTMDNVRTECEGYTAIILSPAGDLLVRIRPEEITQ